MMPGLKDTDAQFAEVDRQMHVLWTWAVGRPGYDKKAWQKLEQGIFDLAKRSAPDADPAPPRSSAKREIFRSIMYLDWTTIFCPCGSSARMDQPFGAWVAEHSPHTSDGGLTCRAETDPTAWYKCSSTPCPEPTVGPLVTDDHW